MSKDGGRGRFKIQKISLYCKFKNNKNNNNKKKSHNSLDHTIVFLHVSRPLHLWASQSHPADMIREQVMTNLLFIQPARHCHLCFHMKFQVPSFISCFEQCLTAILQTIYTSEIPRGLKGGAMLPQDKQFYEHLSGTGIKTWSSSIKQTKESKE